MGPTNLQLKIERREVFGLKRQNPSLHVHAERVWLVKFQQSALINNKPEEGIVPAEISLAEMVEFQFQMLMPSRQRYSSGRCQGTDQNSISSALVGMENQLVAYDPDESILESSMDEPEIIPVPECSCCYGWGFGEDFVRLKWVNFMKKSCFKLISF